MTHYSEATKTGRFVRSGCFFRHQAGTRSILRFTRGLKRDRIMFHQLSKHMAVEEIRFTSLVSNPTLFQQILPGHHHVLFGPSDHFLQMHHHVDTSSTHGAVLSSISLSRRFDFKSSQEPFLPGARCTGVARMSCPGRGANCRYSMVTSMV